MELHKEYYDKSLHSILNELISNLVKEKPNNPIEFSHEFLVKKGDYSKCKKKLKEKEKRELLYYRKEYALIMEKIKTDKKEKEEVVENKKKRCAISSESYGAYNQPHTNFTPIVISKTKHQKALIKKQIKSSVFFKELSDDNLDIVIDAMKEEYFNKGDIIIKTGDEGSLMYFVDEGNLDCFKEVKTTSKRNVIENINNNKDGKSDIKEVLIKEYHPGSSFGELALLYNTARAATIKASTDCKLWSLDRETFHFIFKKLNIDKENKFVGFLKQCTLFKDLSLKQLRQISDAIRVEFIAAENIIIKAGEEGEDFYILENGEAHATIIDEITGKHKVVKVYGSGEYFGELALINKKKRQANVVAFVSNTQLILPLTNLFYYYI